TSSEVHQMPVPIDHNHGEIAITMYARQAAQPSVDGPAAGKRPRSTVRRHEFSNAGDIFGYEGHRLAHRAIGFSKHRYSPYHADHGSSVRTYLCRSEEVALAVNLAERRGR